MDLGGAKGDPVSVVKQLHLLRFGIAAEDALLPDSLARTSAHQVFRAIRADHRERGVRHVRLDYRWKRVRNRRTRRHNHTNVAFLHAGEP